MENGSGRLCGAIRAGLPQVAVQELERELVSRARTACAVMPRLPLAPCPRPYPYPKIPCPANSGARRYRVALVVSCLLFLNFLYFLFSSGRVRTIDEVSAAFQVESLAKHGTAEIPQAVEAKLFYGTFDRFGGPESPYPPGQALAMLPWYAAGQFVAKYLPGVPRDPRDVVSDFFLTGESAFFSALAAALALCIFLAAWNRAENFADGGGNSRSRHASRRVFRLAVFRAACGGFAAWRGGRVVCPAARDTDTVSDARSARGRFWARPFG